MRRSRRGASSGGTSRPSSRKWSASRGSSPPCLLCWTRTRKKTTRARGRETARRAMRGRSRALHTSCGAKTNGTRYKSRKPLLEQYLKFRQEAEDGAKKKKKKKKERDPPSQGSPCRSTSSIPGRCTPSWSSRRRTYW